MKKTLLIGILSLLVFPANSQWVKVWSEEFNIPGLPDSTKWSNEIGFIRNNELQYYTSRRIENAHIDDTCLVIEARKENFMGAQYTSASLTTQFNGDWTYGRIEVRAKIPTGTGSWPAIWMMPTEDVYGGWPRSGEIDIMENIGYEPDNIYTTVHFYGTDGSGHAASGKHTVCTAPYDTFYTYTIEWGPGRIDWFIDADKVHSYSKPLIADWKNWPFNQRFYLILNLAIGGSWGGAYGVADSIFPNKFYIDYVRIYKKQTDPGPYTISINPSVGGSIELSPLQDVYEAGTMVELRALPENGYIFDRYLYMGKANPLTIEMNENKNVIPVFKKEGEMIGNGSFDRNISGWNNIYIYNAQTQAAKAYWDDSIYVFEIAKPATDWWHMGDQWQGIAARQGKTYHVSFDGWADNPGKLGISFSKNHEDWSAYNENTNIDLTTVRKTFVWDFTFNHPSDDNCRLYFGMGRFSAGKVYLDNISMTDTIIIQTNSVDEIVNGDIKVFYQPIAGQISVQTNTAQPGKVIISLYNLAGVRIQTLYNGYLAAGAHELQTQVNKNAAPSGLYFLKYESGNIQAVKKLVIH